MKRIASLTIAFIAAIAFASCNDNVTPKPSAFLSLNYPKPQYAAFESDCPYTFDMNADAVIKGKPNCAFEIRYPKMKATIYLSYKDVHDDINTLLRDAQTLTYKHVIKADDITEQPYLNPEKDVYGMFYQVRGNAATNVQFYVTDSTRHFVAGQMYFYAKPNFDSVMPAAEYVRVDMRRLVESIRWK
jgi:gliding motility-associated lipoprotein GldD